MHVMSPYTVETGSHPGAGPGLGTRRRAPGDRVAPCWSWRDYASRLAWELLRLEPEEVSGQREVWVPLLSLLSPATWSRMKRKMIIMRTIFHSLMFDAKQTSRECRNQVLDSQPGILLDGVCMFSSVCVGSHQVLRLPPTVQKHNC
ncbi:hypothetical protein ILYODFUR_019919 [Ilyodon furcidens]|uniref:Uncharacterized protein n=1 Tax=Ilyodon furcidens TaxID=33524 RepID=A0ABV0TP49_9TELE